MAKRRPLVAANWKMNGSLSTIGPLVDSIVAGTGADAGAEVVLCTPYIYIPELSSRLRDTGIALGAQNVSEHDNGAYTGEVSASMLREFDCQYIIVGHSERRHLYGESDRQVCGKFIKARQHGLLPILCVGELLEEREQGITESVVAAQLDTVIELAGIDGFSEAVIAYEPVWAIGTGRTAEPEQAEEVHEFIRLRLARHDDVIADKIRILYGGSIKTDNAAALFSMANIDGGLVGGASLIAEDFLAICHVFD